MAHVVCCTLCGALYIYRAARSRLAFVFRTGLSTLALPKSHTRACRLTGSTSTFLPHGGGARTVRAGAKGHGAVPP